MLYSFVSWLCFVSGQLPDRVMLALIIIGSILIYEIGNLIVLLIIRVLYFFKKKKEVR